MKENNFNIQLFANIDDIVTQHAEALTGINVKDTLAPITAKLGELGYDVIFNNKSKAEFVPSSRLGEVVSQRDTFKTQVEALNAQLKTLQENSESDSLKTELQKMVDKNTQLITSLETTKVDTAILLEAREANDPNDVLAFINKKNIKTDSKGNLVGVKEEVARIKKEKPYLFGKSINKGGIDNSGDAGDVAGGGMNAMIRRMAGRT